MQTFTPMTGKRTPRFHKMHYFWKFNPLQSRKVYRTSGRKFDELIIWKMNSLVFAAANTCIKLKSPFMHAYWEVNFDYRLSVFGKIEKPLNA